MKDSKPSVSVVIPTRNRPDLVVRAVRSALEQTFGDLEVVVIMDGPDAATKAALSKIHDIRLRSLELPHSLGGAATRNAGVRAATGEWIAFLDDDDEWLAGKLARQLEVASESEAPEPIIACRLVASTPSGEYVWPRRIMRADEHVSEFVMARRDLFQGEGLLQTSMLMARKRLLDQVPFDDHVMRHQEWDWLLRVSRVPGVRIEFAPEPLLIWYVEQSRSSISNQSNWRYSFDWIRQRRQLVTERAYAGFLMTLVTALAARARDWSAIRPLLTEAVRFGRPDLAQLAVFAGLWLLPTSFRRRLRRLATSAVL